MHIKRITEYTSEIRAALVGFLNQLITREVDLTETFLRELIASENSHLFCAVDDDGQCVGMITVGVYFSPTGKKAWIEDVVVTAASRGQGIGKMLTEKAIQFAKEQTVQSLMLTSNPARVAANNLYRSMGFEQRETNVYRMILE
jgi:ribosomal protein S18 acetylase RimI-like enzyme